MTMSCSFGTCERRKMSNSRSEMNGTLRLSHLCYVCVKLVILVTMHVCHYHCMVELSKKKACGKEAS